MVTLKGLKTPDSFLSPKYTPASQRRVRSFNFLTSCDGHIRGYTRHGDCVTRDTVLKPCLHGSLSYHSSSSIQTQCENFAHTSLAMLLVFTSWITVPTTMWSTCSEATRKGQTHVYKHNEWMHTLKNDAWTQIFGKWWVHMITPT